MRRAFAQAITEMALNDERLVILIGDVGGNLFDEFKSAFPLRFFNIGIAEQSMVSIASGMAIHGLRPVVYTLTPFLIERAFEQIKIDINGQCAPVGLVGYADYPDQGITHAEIDAPWLRSKFNNIVSYYPQSGQDARSIIRCIKMDSPWFISLKKDK